MRAPRSLSLPLPLWLTCLASGSWGREAWEAFLELTACQPCGLLYLCMKHIIGPL